MMRSMLYMAALNAVRTNLRMKFFYKRLTDRGKPRKVALIAVARKLALIAYIYCFFTLTIDCELELTSYGLKHGINLTGGSNLEVSKKVSKYSITLR